MFDQLGRWLRRRQGIERNPIYRLATDVAAGRMPVEAAYRAVERTSVLNQLADGDLRDLDREAELAAEHDPERALTLARLTILAARYKGFDRVLVDANLRAADLLAKMGEEREQELHLREALHAAERIAYVTGQRRVLSRLARLTFDRGETERARDLLGRQLEAGREDADTLEDVETAILLGDLARNDGDNDAAREYYHRAERSARRVGHYAGVVEAALRQVVILREIGDADAAVLLLTQAQEAAARTIDTRLQAEIAIQTGALLAEQHQYQQSRLHLLNALERARGMGDITIESRCLTGLSRVEQRSGLLSEAAEHYTALADLEQRLGNRTASVRALLDAAQIYLQLRAPDQALSALITARPVSESMDEPGLRQRVLGMLGMTYGAMDRRTEAVECLMGAVQQARRAGDVEQEGQWLLGIGEVLAQFGEFDDAGAAIRRCIEIAQQEGNQRLEAQAMGLLGTMYMARGLHRDAEESLQRALSLSRYVDDPTEQLGYVQGLARLGMISGQPQVAIRHLHHALDIAALYSGPETRSRLHGQLGRLHASLNQFRDAEEHYASAFAAAEEAESLSFQAKALRGLASVQDNAGRLDQAIETYGRAAELAEEIGDLRNAAALRYNLGAILNDRGQEDEARTQLNKSLESAMAAGDYATADAARALLRWFAPRREDQSASGWGEDLLIDEIAVGDESIRLREHLRE